MEMLGGTAGHWYIPRFRPIFTLYCASFLSTVSSLGSLGRVTESWREAKTLG